jgi:hypothetical protein
MTDEATIPNFFSHPFAEMDPYPHGRPRPVHVRLRELDFALAGGELKFYFWGGKDIRLTGGDAEFETLIDEVCNPNYRIETPAPPLKEEWANPLSLQNGELAYVVYRLRRGKNWEIADRSFPFSVGRKGHHYCFDAHRVWSSFRDRDQGGPVRTGCFLGYFIADGATPKGITGRYDFPINVHVDLLFAGGKRMPIIIDPDVRYPGGSGSEDP